MANQIFLSHPVPFLFASIWVTVQPQLSVVSHISFSPFQFEILFQIQALDDVKDGITHEIFAF
jgi:hypothetical protein